MKIKNLIGQQFIWGIHGTTLTPELKSFLKEYPVGGIIFYKRNFKSKKQIKEFIKEIKNVCKKQRPIISTDHEGGNVIRFTRGFTKLPSAKKIGDEYKKSGNFRFAKKISNAMIKELKEIGINLNFYPLVDINTNIHNPIIGSRAFSDDSKIVSSLGTFFIKEFNKRKLISCAKHFPGHGATLYDSHKTLPVLPFDLKRLWNLELIPFIDSIKAKVPMIMTAHIKFPKIDKYPATLSKYFLYNILRKRLKYQGVIVSDDLDMSAIKNHFNRKSSLEKMIKASVDMFIIATDKNNQAKYFEELIKLAEKKSFIRNKILESNKRIKAMKIRFKI